MSDAQHKKEFSIIGIIVTVAATAGFIWAASQWYYCDSDQMKLSIDRIQANELNTFTNLQVIFHAQKKYKEKDWDGDGNKIYAIYFVHLWTSVSTKGEPVLIDLIPKKLAFAMEADKAVNGYYFIDLHDKITRGVQTQVPIDYGKEWVVLALPAGRDRTGVLNFLADQSGSIFVNTAESAATQYPEKPDAAGWIKIEDIEQLKDFQKKTIYPADN